MSCKYGISQIGEVHPGAMLVSAQSTINNQQKPRLLNAPHSNENRYSTIKLISYCLLRSAVF